jgi:ABC-type Mn2+/Zn2+ transport system permease subunit
VSDLLALDFMRQALLAALLAGFAAPLVGVFLVQRRMSLIGDGMGHVALAGVAVGVLTGQGAGADRAHRRRARGGRDRADPGLGAHER